MLGIISLQQSGQMTSHMATPNANQDVVLAITLILGLIVILLIAGIIILLYLFYTGRLTFAGRKKTIRSPAIESNPEPSEKNTINQQLPDVSLNPLERKILEVVMTSHNVLQSDLPALVNSSKSKVSEALSYLEDQKLIQRMKAGRSLTIQYIYEPTK